jgi:sugar-specific transcriptional regulator TrmB
LADQAHDENVPAAPGPTGLDPEAEGLYRLLLSRTDASVSRLAADAGLGPARTRDLLMRLVDDGFATMVADSRFRAVGPDTVLGGRIASQLGDVLGEYEALRELLEIHRAGPGSGGGDHGSWEVVTGPVAIRSRLRQLKAGAEKRLRTFVRPPMVLPVPEPALHEDLQARGICHRILFDRAVLDIDPYSDYLRHALSSGDEVRFAKRLPLKLLIVDDKTALMEEGGGRPKAIVTSNRSIVEIAGALFDQLWSTGIPATTAASSAERLDEDDAVLLGLLISGLTDQSIATKLGIGLRTVQRRVRELMDLADVDTRIQLGWHAAKNGWVP